MHAVSPFFPATADRYSREIFGPKYSAVLERSAYCRGHAIHVKRTSCVVSARSTKDEKIIIGPWLLCHNSFALSVKRSDVDLDSIFGGDSPHVGNSQKTKN
jgi:hypothetical protein